MRLPYIAWVLFATSVLASAQPAPARVDTILLKDGSRIEGHVKDQVRGQYAVIEVSDGSVRTITWDRISEVVVWSKPAEPPTLPPGPVAPSAVAPSPAAPPRPAAAFEVTTGQPLRIGHPKKKKVMRVATTIAFEATKDGAGIGRTVKCTTNGDQTCKESEQLTIGREGPKATYSSETDCSKKPGSGACTETKAVGVSAAGIGASYTKEEVVAVDESSRPSGSVNFSLTGSVGGGFGNPSGLDVAIFMTNLDANLKLLKGGPFPKRAGGNWVGFAFEPTAGFLFQSVNTSGSIAGTSISSTSSATGFRGGVSAGLQLMHFNQLDSKSLKQRGVGVFLGAFVGYQQTQSSDGMGGMTSSGAASVGPQLDIVFPSYNPGTAKYSSASLNFMVLPTGDFIFITVGFADSF